MERTYRLKLYSKVNLGEGIELGSLERKCNADVITQWLLTPRAKRKSRFFLVLVDQEDNCIDAKYISKQTMLVCLNQYQTVN